MKKKAHEVARFTAGFARAHATYRVILIYGPDQGGVRALGQKLAHAFLGNAPDPMQYCTLSDTQINTNPSLVYDEAAAVPMFGTKKLLSLRCQGDSSAAVIEAYLAKPVEEALIIIETGNLKPTANLRKLIEKNSQSMALPCFPADARDRTQIAKDYLHAEGFRIDAAALQLLASKLSADRGVMQRELERLVLYMGPTTPAHNNKADPRENTTLIGVDHIAAIMGDSATASFDTLVDSVALGKLQNADTELSRLVREGISPDRAIGAISRHFQALHLAIGKCKKGASPTEALSAFVPFLHFKRHDLVKQQIATWSQRKVENALHILHEAETACADRYSGQRSGKPHHFAHCPRMIF